MTLNQGSDLQPITIPSDTPFAFTLDKAELDPAKTLHKGGFVAPRAGWYLIIGQAAFGNLLTYGTVNLFLSINGAMNSAWADGYYIAQVPMVGSSQTLTGQRMLYLHANDFVQLTALVQTTGVGSQSSGPAATITATPSTQYGTRLQIMLSGYSL
jgi:hypothetical protein